MPTRNRANSASASGADGRLPPPPPDHQARSQRARATCQSRAARHGRIILPPAIHSANLRDRSEAAPGAVPFTISSRAVSNPSIEDAAGVLGEAMPPDAGGCSRRAHRAVRAAHGRGAGAVLWAPGARGRIRIRSGSAPGSSNAAARPGLAGASRQAVDRPANLRRPAIPGPRLVNRPPHGFAPNAPREQHEPGSGAAVIRHAEDGYYHIVGDGACPVMCASLLGAWQWSPGRMHSSVSSLFTPRATWRYRSPASPLQISPFQIFRETPSISTYWPVRIKAMS